MRRGADPCSIARHDFLLLTAQRGHFEDFNDGHHCMLSDAKA